MNSTEEIEQLEDEVDRLQTLNIELCTSIKSIYAIVGEDEAVAKICNETLEKYED